MPCYKPLLAWQTGGGEIVFVERLGKDVRRELQLPCNQCIGCRLERSRKWAMRCVHESRLHKQNAFVTLTYSPEHMPKRGNLSYRPFQLFMKRLRKEKGDGIKFYMCGEYGPENWRPHFHALLFGVDFEDKVFWSQMAGSGAAIYRSDELERLWPFGFCSIGDVTFESAAYVARYCMQKVNGTLAKYHYAREDAEGKYMLTPEFNRMSNRPGIGGDFYEKYKADMYPHDYVIVNGRKLSIPKYYDKRAKKENPEEYEELQWQRERLGRAQWEDNTPVRLAVKEAISHVRLAFLKRRLNEY